MVTRNITHILLIDDEEDCHYVTKLVLKKAGYKGDITCFTSADEALERLRAGAGHPDLMMVDINMPGMSGFEFVEACEKEGLLPDARTSVVMFSSSNRPQDLETSRNYDSVMAYVEKALTVEEFERIASAHLKRA